MIQALVMTHGNLGAELVHICELVLGPSEGLTALSNSGRSGAEMAEAAREWLAGCGEDGAIVLVDDYGGSCSTAAQLACGQDPQRAIISGVNLAMVLGFLTWRDSDDVPELAARLVRKGREAITLVGGR
jgi:mannose/fructose-specific phosphotransferase system component IIA